MFETHTKRASALLLAGALLAAQGCAWSTDVTEGRMSASVGIATASGSEVTATSEGFSEGGVAVITNGITALTNLALAILRGALPAALSAPAPVPAATPGGVATGAIPAHVHASDGSTDVTVAVDVVGP